MRFRDIGNRFKVRMKREDGTEFFGRIVFYLESRKFGFFLIPRFAPDREATETDNG